MRIRRGFVLAAAVLASALVVAGCARLVGTDQELIVAEAALVLGDPWVRARMTAAGNPYGDGLAARRTEEAVAALLGLAPMPAPMSEPRELTTLGAGTSTLRISSR